MLSVITPSYNSGSWLRLCIASVADQGIPVEHIVQDAGSTDGTGEWLPRDSRVKSFIENDQGMYDAINRGARRSSGELLSWLNCDEQYLPGTVKLVSDWFEAHPDVDVLYGDVIFVGVNGRYLFHRKMQVPLKYHTWTCHLSTLSCGMFFRRSLLFDRNFWFDAKLRDTGDGEWMVRLLNAGTKMAALNGFTSIFTRTGQNMSAAPNAFQEAKQLRATAPVWAQAARPLFVVQHRLRRWLGNMYRQAPFSYEIYTMDSLERRKRFDVANPQGRFLTA